MKTIYQTLWTALVTFPIFIAVTDGLGLSSVYWKRELHWTRGDIGFGFDLHEVITPDYLRLFCGLLIVLLGIMGLHRFSTVKR